MFVFSISSLALYVVISHLSSVFLCNPVPHLLSFSSDYLSAFFIGSHSSSLSINVWLFSLFFAWSSCYSVVISCSMSQLKNGSGLLSKFTFLVIKRDIQRNLPCCSQVSLCTLVLFNNTL
ncbi:hypothetical protein CHARACLAT_022314 [Characodon lateralis]|uniref:Secreted protein n=1 Tax=Characodon lateralis TaxID=208331 RepID=A0ABU7D940_9TELE|nr:hypothetical protein [Characodon lateralis]